MCNYVAYNRFYKLCFLHLYVSISLQLWCRGDWCFCCMYASSRLPRNNFSGVWRTSHNLMNTWLTFVQLYLSDMCICGSVARLKETSIDTLPCINERELFGFTFTELWAYFTYINYFTFLCFLLAISCQRHPVFWMSMCRCVIIY